MMAFIVAHDIFVFLNYFANAKMSANEYLRTNSKLAIVIFS